MSGQSGKEKIIIDGDWGSDEMQLAAVLLAHPERADILGATAVFGNASHHYVLQNASDILHFLKAGHVPVYPGAKRPSDSTGFEGDGAHGNTGLGHATLAPSPVPPKQQDAADYILDTLRHEPARSVTITATGPLTNLANAWRKDPDTMRRVKQIVVMGGCTEDLPAADRPTRRGNITLDAEFNFYMAPGDAQTVMQSGLPITLMPMNCTQQLSLTPARDKQLSHALMRHPEARKAVLGMMRGPATLDREKFGASPFMHDVHCALYVLHPELYRTERGSVTVATDAARQGRSEAVADVQGSTTIATGLNDPERAFGLVSGALEKRILPARGRQIGEA